MSAVGGRAAALARVSASPMGQMPVPKPRLRGVSHQWAFFCALVAGLVLVTIAPNASARTAAAIYAASLAAMFGTSALYHRLDWRPRARRWMRRLDHSMIFVLVAGTYTPFAALVLGETLGTVLLAIAWSGALGGVILQLAWTDSPRWLDALVYIGLGWVSVIAMPQLLDRAGVGAVVLLALGGLFYSAGAIVYARKRPDPSPAVFGYHEIFHVLVIAAAIAHYVAIAAYALPAG